MTRKVCLVITLISLMGMGCLSKTDAGENNPVAIGAPAPMFSLQDQRGRMVNLSDFAGKVIVLEWVNPDCPFVQRHYRSKTMKTLAEKFGRKGIVWLAINTTHYMNKQDDTKWVDRYQLPYPILDDHLGAVGKLYGAKTTPHMFIIDKSGRLVYMGAIDNDRSGRKDQRLNYVEKALEELLAGKAVSTPQTKSYGCSVKYAN